ncbi:MAG: nucleoside triphosphate pyrophosphohydrolase [Deltaproteobacteria bacterium]|jgi:ATP diphosphatase|nr:nucleoside triphosphate pyrophosphohydrolase [Deltaproteobacteria bacterium]
MTLPEDKNAENGRALAGVTDMLEKLLGPEGCPWDREQTVESLCAYALEEMYELVDAVRNGSPEEQREEMGDVLFILLFMSRLQDRRGRFTLAEVLEENRAKMIGRHPHVFGNLRVEGREELFSVWEKVKRAEKARKDSPPGLFASLPAALPALLKAYRIHSKSAQYNFTWDTDEDAEMQVEAEWLELIDACRSGDPEALEHELGDLLFSIVELGRRRGVKAETALDKANTRFLRRFSGMESLAAGRGLDFASLSQAEKDALWEEIKREETR